MKDEELFEGINADLMAAASKRNPGVKPETQTLTEREKIIITAIRRHPVEPHAGLSATQMRMVERVAPKGED